MHGSQPSELLNNDRYGSRRKVHRFFAIFDCLEHALPLSNVAHAAADTDAGADAGIVHALLSSSLSMLAVSFVSRLDRPTSPQAWPPQAGATSTGFCGGNQCRYLCTASIQDDLGKIAATSMPIVGHRDLCQIHAPHTINHDQKVLAACGQLLLWYNDPQNVPKIITATFSQMPLTHITTNAAPS